MNAGELATAVADVRHSLLGAIEGEVGHIVGLYRLEVRRTVTAVALGLTAGFCACGAVVLTILSVVLVFWETHRALAVGLSAVSLALLATLCGLIVRACTSPAARRS